MTHAERQIAKRGNTAHVAELQAVDAAIATGAHWRRLGHSEHASRISACHQLARALALPTLAHAARVLDAHSKLLETERVTNSALGTGAL